MIDPLVNAANFFVGFYQMIPFPIRALVGLALGLFLIRAIISILWTTRG